MKQCEYIPGDLVMTNGAPIGTAKGVVYRVTSSDPNKTLILDNGNTIKGTVSLENVESPNLGDDGYLFCESGAWVKDIVPIPLTPEILEKNGWEKKDDMCWKSYDLVTLVVQYNNCRIVDLCSNLILRSLEYVHELQHLLFGLDDNSEIKV